MKIKHFLSSIAQGFCKIKLVDRCLIIFMALLMIQTNYALFFNESSSMGTNDIDIVVRTTSAGIFGYFLSVNFLKSSLDSANAKRKKLNIPAQRILKIDAVGAPVDEGTPTNMKRNIGFNPTPLNTESQILNEPILNSPELEKEGEEEYEEEYQEEKVLVTNQQIIIATVIGLSAFLTLAIVRNFLTLTPEMSAAISQLRDFVSGCVGFLLGCPTGSSVSKK